MKKIGLLLLISFGFLCAQSQDQIFRTVYGTALIEGEIADSCFTATSREVMVLLDYETTEIRIKLKLSSFVTNIDSIDALLCNSFDEEIEFVGRTNLDHINTESNGKWEFEVSGMLDANNESVPVYGTGTLEHTYSTPFACILWLTFFIQPSQWGGNLERFKMTDELQINIIQTLLEKDE